jgi:hypothetical protein
MGVIGALLIVAGAIVLILRGVSYTKDRDAVKVGPVEVAAEKKGFISPAIGAVAVVAGLVLVLGSRRASA